MRTYLHFREHFVNTGSGSRVFIDYFVQLSTKGFTTSIKRKIGVTHLDVLRMILTKITEKIKKKENPGIPGYPGIDIHKIPKSRDRQTLPGLESLVSMVASRLCVHCIRTESSSSGNRSFG